MNDDEQAPLRGIVRLSHRIRSWFQLFLAGVGAIYIVLFILGALRNGVYAVPPTFELDHAQLFGFIGGLLGVSAAVELAFMLLTEGPDEAVDPLLLSISAAALIALGKAKGGSAEGWAQLVPYITILICSVSILILFYVRERYLKKPRRPETAERPAEPATPLRWGNVGQSPRHE